MSRQGKAKGSQCWEMTASLEPCSPLPSLYKWGDFSLEGWGGQRTHPRPLSEPGLGLCLLARGFWNPRSYSTGCAHWGITHTPYLDQLAVPARYTEVIGKARGRASVYSGASPALLGGGARPGGEPLGFWPP